MTTFQRCLVLMAAATLALGGCVSSEFIDAYLLGGSADDPGAALQA